MRARANMTLILAALFGAAAAQAEPRVEQVIGAGSTIEMHYVCDGTGLCDEQPAAPQGSNSAPTRGAQVLEVFKAAARYYADRLIAAAPVTVRIQVSPLGCPSSSGGGVLLGRQRQSALLYASEANPDRPLTMIPNRWYSLGHGVGLMGEPAREIAFFSDFTPGPDITRIELNAFIEDCAIPTPMFRGLAGDPIPPGQYSAYNTLLHEFGHGLGMALVYCAESTQLCSDGQPAVFTGEGAMDVFLVDRVTGKASSEMTLEERRTAFTTDGRLIWTGEKTRAQALAQGIPSGLWNGYPLMNSASGQVAHHFDASFPRSEVMAIRTGGAAEELAAETLALGVLRDMGWRGIQDPEPPPPAPEDTLQQLIADTPVLQVGRTNDALIYYPQQVRALNAYGLPLAGAPLKGKCEVLPGTEGFTLGFTVRRPDGGQVQNLLTDGQGIGHFEIVVMSAASGPVTGGGLCTITGRGGLTTTVLVEAVEDDGTSRLPARIVFENPDFVLPPGVNEAFAFTGEYFNAFDSLGRPVAERELELTCSGGDVSAAPDSMVLFAQPGFEIMLFAAADGGPDPLRLLPLQPGGSGRGFLNFYHRSTDQQRSGEVVCMLRDPSGGAISYFAIRSAPAQSVTNVFATPAAPVLQGVEPTDLVDLMIQAEVLGGAPATVRPFDFICNPGSNGEPLVELAGAAPATTDGGGEASVRIRATTAVRVEQVVTCTAFVDGFQAEVEVTVAPAPCDECVFGSGFEVEP